DRWETISAVIIRKTLGYFDRAERRQLDNVGAGAGGAVRVRRCVVVGVDDRLDNRALPVGGDLRNGGIDGDRRRVRRLRQRNQEPRPGKRRRELRFPRRRGTRQLALKRATDAPRHEPELIVGRRKIREQLLVGGGELFSYGGLIGQSADLGIPRSENRLI